MDTGDQETDEWRVIDSTQSASDFSTDDESSSSSYTNDETSSFSSEDSTDSECRRKKLQTKEKTAREHGQNGSRKKKRSLQPVRGHVPEVYIHVAPYLGATQGRNTLSIMFGTATSHKFSGITLGGS